MRKFFDYIEQFIADLFNDLTMDDGLNPFDPLQEDQAPDMPDYVQRMVEERHALFNKIVALRNMLNRINDDQSVEIDEVERAMMMSQLRAMDEYYSSLDSRFQYVVQKLKSAV